MSQTTLPTIQVSDADRFPCCDPATCKGCGCCHDDKGGESSCC